jgi:hypothetical protein
MGLQQITGNEIVNSSVTAAEAKEFISTLP